MTYHEALEAALCYGWIDAQKRPESEHAWRQRFAPRQTKSIWSKINRQKALALIEAGRMQPAGLEQVEHNMRAKAFFAALDSANRYAVLFRIQTAKRADTRARRIRQFVEMLARHEKLHP